MSSPSNLTKPCSICGHAVHARSERCKNCNSPSPWRAEAAETTAPDSSTLPVPTAEPAPVAVPVAAPAPSYPATYLVLRSFRQSIGEVTVSLIGGRLVEDEMLAKMLIAAGAPVKAIYDIEDLVTCPHCRHVFTVEEAVEAEGDEAA
jgi:hypothetical protein